MICKHPKNAGFGGGKSLENFAAKKVILSESERKQQICDDTHTAAIRWSPVATVLPRNRGLKTCGHRSKKDIACRSGTPLKPPTTISPQQRTLSARIIHYGLISEGSRTLSYEARRSPSATNITTPPHHRHSFGTGRLISDAYQQMSGKSNKLA